MRHLRRFNEDTRSDVEEAAKLVGELLWEFGDEIRKAIEIDKNNNLSVIIKPKYVPIRTLEDAKTGQAIRLGEDFVERLWSIGVMLQELRLTNVYEITWTNVTEKGNRTRRRSQVDKKFMKKMVAELADKPIHVVRITAGRINPEEETRQKGQIGIKTKIV